MYSVALQKLRFIPRPSPAMASAALKSLLPEVDWLLAHCTSNGEWLRFPAEFVDVLARLKIEKYASLYLAPMHIPMLLVQALYDAEDLSEFERLAAEGSEAEFRELMDWAIREGLTASDAWTIPKTAAEREAAKRYWDALSKQEQDEATRFCQVMWTAFLATFFNYLSAMVHRVPLTTLVPAAVNGDDEALVMAVQIDRSILTDLPYAVDRYRRATRECDWTFLDKLAYRIANPVIRGKIRFRQLWFALAMLDTMNLLDGTLTHKEILDLLNEAGLDKYDNRIEAVEYLSKRLGEFRQFQARAMGNVPRKPFLRHSARR